MKPLDYRRYDKYFSFVLRKNKKIIFKAAFHGIRIYSIFIIYVDGFLYSFLFWAKIYIDLISDQ